jgi:hypothetical protein
VTYNPWTSRIERRLCQQSSLAEKLERLLLDGLP